MFYIDNDQELEANQEWFDSLDNEHEHGMREAVRIQDPISSMQLMEPLIIDLGTSLRHVLDTMQDSKRNCILTLNNEKLGGILTERDSFLKVTGKTTKNKATEH